MWVGDVWRAERRPDRCEITSGALRGIGNAVAIQQAAFQGDGGRPVEVLQAAGLLETGALKPQFNAPVGAVIDLVAEDDLQEGCIVQLLSAGFCGGRLLPGRGQGYSPLLNLSIRCENRELEWQDPDTGQLIATFMDERARAGAEHDGRSPRRGT